MAIMKKVIDAMSELLIENMTMKELLKGRTNLQEILRNAKADPNKQQHVREILAPLGDAICDEVAVEQLFQKIAERASAQGQSSDDS